VAVSADSLRVWHHRVHVAGSTCSVFKYISGKQVSITLIREAQHCFLNLSRESIYRYAWLIQSIVIHIIQTCPSLPSHPVPVRARLSSMLHIFLIRPRCDP
jgi:hypothetical protein